MKLHPHEPPREVFAQLPTPVAELKNLAKQQGVPRILMKRDDLTGLEVSGNKIRKLEYVIAEALTQGADTIVTHGGAQSNHCRASAAIGARLGLRTRLILRSNEAQPEQDGNLFLDQLFGAECSFHKPEEYQQEFADLVETTMEREKAAGRRPYFFPVGASTPLGCWGYIRCVTELVDQLGRELPVDIYCATSSGGTQAGLILGKAMFQCDNWSIRGVPVSDSCAYFQTALRKLLADAVKQYGLELSPDDTTVELVDGFIGQGYAIPYPEATETIRLSGRLEGIVLDPSYTSKAMTGMLADMKVRHTGRIPLFLHTGGAFGLFARRDLLY